MIHQLAIERFGYLADNQDGEGDDFFGVEGWK